MSPTKTRGATAAGSSGGPTISADVRLADTFVRHIVILVYLFPVLWFIGLGGTLFLIAALPSFLYLIRANKGLESKMAIAIAVTICLSLPVGFWYFGVDLVRGLSISGNIAVWVTLAAGLSAARLVSVRPRLSYALVSVAAVQGALTLVSIAIHPAKLPVPLLSGYASSMPSGLGGFAENTLVYQGWLGGVTHRSAGMMANGTWGGAVAALAVIIALAELSRQRHKAFLICGMLLASVSVYYSLSRSTWILLAAALMIGVVFVLRQHNKLVFTTVLTVGIPLTLMAVFVGRDELVDVLDDVNEERAGSAVSRLAIYVRTLEYVKEGILWLGFGLKPRESDLVAPVASHSTYIGVLFRAGIVGLVLLFILLFRLLSDVISQNNATGAAVLVFVACWMGVADLDTGHLVPLFLLFCIRPTSVQEGVGVGVSEHRKSATLAH